MVRPAGVEPARHDGHEARKTRAYSGSATGACVNLRDELANGFTGDGACAFIAIEKLVAVVRIERTTWRLSTACSPAELHGIGEWKVVVQDGIEPSRPRL